MSGEGGNDGAGTGRSAASRRIQSRVHRARTSTSRAKREQLVERSKERRRTSHEVDFSPHGSSQSLETDTRVE